jgi:Tfp pilus assembly protein PilF
MQNSDTQLQRARHLYQINRKEQAIEELTKLLETDPENIDALYIIVPCLIEIGNTEKADIYWQKLVQLTPNVGLTHYYHAIILDKFDKEKEAEEAIWEAIHLEPYDADFWAFLTAIYIDKKEWEKALEYAEKGLEIEPENTLCLNHRTLCLTKLDRKDELHDSILDALNANPYNSYTHTNVGWSKLEKNQNNDAEEHFKEALRIDPNNDYAKEGMKETIKARNPIYRLFLNYSFWIGKQQSLVQWAVILGVYFAQRTLPPPFSTIVMIIVLTSWLITPLSNFILIFDKNGKFLLTNLQRIGATIIGTLIGISILGVTVGLLFNLPDITTIIGLFGVFASLPIAGLTSSESNYKLWWIKVIGFGLPICGIFAVLIMLSDYVYQNPNIELFNSVWDIFSIGSILTTWFFAFRSR